MAESLDFRPERVNITAIQGTDMSFTVNITESDGTTPIDITDFDFTMDVIDAKGVVLQALSIGSGITITDGPDGQLQISIEGTNFEFNTKCDVSASGLLWVTDNNSIRRPYAQFIFTLSPVII